MCLHPAHCGSGACCRACSDDLTWLQGKVLILITNSDYVYTDTMMSYAYDPYLPEGRSWRDLFDMVIVQARPEQIPTASPRP